MHLNQWEELTSDPEILTTVSEMHIEMTDNLSEVELYQNPFNKKEQEFITAEIKTLLPKPVIVETKHEPRAFIPPIFDGCFRLILNLKRLNEVLEYKKFTIETISRILHLIRPGMYMAKVDIKDAYYSTPICENHFEVSIPNLPV